MWLFENYDRQRFGSRTASPPGRYTAIGDYRAPLVASVIGVAALGVTAGVVGCALECNASGKVIVFGSIGIGVALSVIRYGFWH
jgi:hypothetical protein